MTKRIGWLVLLLACVGPAAAQGHGELAGLRSTYALQRPWAEGVRAQRAEVAERLRQLATRVAETGGPGPTRTALLADAQATADRLAALNDEVAAAEAALAETRHRLTTALEARIQRLRTAATDTAATAQTRDSLRARARALEEERATLERRARAGARGQGGVWSGPAPEMVALAGVVAEEQRRLETLDGLRDELGVFVAGLRLFDETGMPPSARSGAGDEPGAGCPIASCPVSGFSPTDGWVPEHGTGSAPGSRRAGSTAAVTAASLADLHRQLAGWVAGEGAGPVNAPERWTRHLTVGVAAMGFRAGEGDREGLGPKAGASWVLTRALGGDLDLTVEPSLGVRAVRVGDAFVEGAVEVRETLARAGAGTRWELGAWQKVRVVPEAFSPAEYLEPGRGEGGFVGRLVMPVGARWQAEVLATGDAVRYAPEAWRVLNRHGGGGGVGVARLGSTGSARLAARATHHRFPERASPLAPYRADTRFTVSLDGALEAGAVLRLSTAATWNRSRIAAYRYTAARAAVVAAVPWRAGSVQVYAGLSHQAYPSGSAGTVARDDDTGSVVSLQYARPVGEGRLVTVRVGWMRSRTGLGDDFYQRLWAALQLGFRGG
jgi:hypothetical protein